VPTRHPPVEGSWSAGPSPVARRQAVPLRKFLDTEGAGGLVLLIATAIALVWVNSLWRAMYEALWETELALEVGRWALALDLRHWVNDGLMALFFFVVGLELKRELVIGELRTWRRAALPVVAVAVGLVAGKLVGISGGAWLALRLRVGALPEGVTGRQLVAVATVAGIGFTVALFIAGLAYPAPGPQDQVRVGIPAGSLLAAAFGALLLHRSLPPVSSNTVLERRTGDPRPRAGRRLSVAARRRPGPPRSPRSTAMPP
jgi:Na+/H+ antiporter NhaA